MLKVADSSKTTKKVDNCSSSFQIKRKFIKELKISRWSLCRQLIKRVEAHTWKFNAFFLLYSDVKLKTLFRLIRSTKIIRKLDLPSEYFCELTDLRLFYLGKVLKFSIAVRNLSLDLYADIHISDKGLSHLCKGLKRLRFLKKLFIDIRGCMKITEFGFRCLVGALKVLTSLRTVYLVLPEALSLVMQLEPNKASFCAEQ